MRSAQFLDDVVSRLRAVIGRAKSAVSGVTPEAFNRQPARGVWSPAQVFEHMMLANKRYLPATRSALERAEPAQDGEVKHSWFGRVVIRAVRPQGNAPAPRMLHPGPGPYGFDLVDRWTMEHEEIIRLAERARGMSLDTRLRNPFMPIFSMRLADCFEILTSHAERHVAQIEDRLK